jgi:hypothetical protein
MQKIKPGIYIIDTEYTFASIKKDRSKWKVLGFSLRPPQTRRFHTTTSSLTEAQRYVEAIDEH